MLKKAAAYDLESGGNTMRNVRGTVMFVVVLVSGVMPGHVRAATISDTLSVHFTLLGIPGLATCTIDEAEPDDLTACVIAGRVDGLHGGFPILQAVNMREDDGTISDVVMLFATQFG